MNKDNNRISNTRSDPLIPQEKSLDKTLMVLKGAFVISVFMANIRVLRTWSF